MPTGVFRLHAARRDALQCFTTTESGWSHYWWLRSVLQMSAASISAPPALPIWCTCPFLRLLRLRGTNSRVSRHLSGKKIENPVVFSCWDSWISATGALRWSGSASQLVTHAKEEVNQINYASDWLLYPPIWPLSNHFSIWSLTMSGRGHIYIPGSSSIVGYLFTVMCQTIRYSSVLGSRAIGAEFPVIVSGRILN